MKRVLLGLAVAAAGAFVTPPASAAVCGETFQPPCVYCVEPDWTFGPLVCVDLSKVVGGISG